MNSPKNLDNFLALVIEHYQSNGENQNNLLIVEHSLKYKRDLKNVVKDFYNTYLKYLLKSLSIKTNVFSDKKELFDLYDLINHINSFYCTEQIIAEHLINCTLLKANESSEIVKYLLLFFKNSETIYKHLHNPAKLTIKELKFYFDLIPNNKSWSMALLLKQFGFNCASSKAGQVAYSRFTFGLFDLSENKNKNQAYLWNTELSNWIELFYFDGYSNTKTKPSISLNLLNNYLMAFTNELNHLNVLGNCTKNPNCKTCPLNSKCMWAQNPQDQNNQENLLAKFNRISIETFNTFDLLGLLLNLDNQQIRALQDNIPNQFPLSQLSKQTLSALKQLPNSSNDFAEKLKVLFELAKRFAEEKLTPDKEFNQSWDIFNHYKLRMRDMRQETFICLLLNNRNRLLREVRISLGILNKSLVHPREAFSPAIESRAANVIFIHNHPSGDSSASEEDKNVTTRLVEVGKMVGINVLDHIIIGNDSYFSFSDEGLI